MGTMRQQYSCNNPFTVKQKFKNAESTMITLTRGPIANVVWDPEHFKTVVQLATEILNISGAKTDAGPKEFLLSCQKCLFKGNCSEVLSLDHGSAIFILKRM